MRAGRVSLCVSLAVAAAAFAPADAQDAAAPDPLAEQFRDPPASARPRVEWPWLDGNVSQGGIASDLAWMKRAGIGGVQQGDEAAQTPQIVDAPAPPMSLAWKDAMIFATGEAARLGLEFAVSAPLAVVAPEDATKKLVWSEIELEGGAALAVGLPQPPVTTGPFQTAPLGGGTDAARDVASAYSDVAVLAYPVSARAEMPESLVYDAAGERLASDALTDGDFSTAIRLAARGDGSPASLVQVFASPVAIRSARLFAPVQAQGTARLEASPDGVEWTAVATFAVGSAQTTASFDPVTAQYFRIVFALAAPVAVAEFELLAEAKVDRFEAKAGFGVGARDVSASGATSPVEGVDPDSVIDLTDKLRGVGRLVWTPPPGRWRVVRLGWSLTGTAGARGGLALDPYDGVAARRSVDAWLDALADALGGQDRLKDKVRALVAGPPRTDGANWTPGFAGKFAARRGYDPIPWLPVLTGTIVGSRARSDAFLHDFRQTLAELAADEQSGALASVAHARGLAVYGDVSDPAPGVSLPRHADVPLVTLAVPARGTQPPAQLVALKAAVSAANVYGKGQAAARIPASSAAPWSASPAALKRVIDLALVSGVTRPVLHASVHQPRDDRQPGLSLGIADQNFTRHQTWAEFARPWTDAIARNAFLLQQGRRVADIGYVAGEDPSLPAVKGHDFDLLDSGAVLGALANDGADVVTPGGARYRALYLGAGTQRMTLPVLSKLAVLAEGGATIIGEPPQDDPSLGADSVAFVTLVSKLWPGGAGGTGVAAVGKGRVIAQSGLDAGLAAAGIAPDFRYAAKSRDADIAFLHRRLADGDGYFVVNRGDRAESIEARFRVTGKAAELWHADSGRIEPVSYRIEGGETVVPLTLDPGESLHVMFRRDASVPAVTVPDPAPRQIAAIEGPWTVRFQGGRGAPEFVVLPALAPLDSHPQDGVRHFSGIATYEKVFSAPAGGNSGDSLWIDLGEVREMAEVRVNGEVSGIAWRAPYRVDIGKAVRPGLNRLEVRVANLWANRLIGDAGAGEGAQTHGWTSAPADDGSAPLPRSGLIGPVRLMTGN